MCLGFAFCCGVATLWAEEPFPEALIPADSLVPAEVEASALPADLLDFLRGEEAFRGEEGASPSSVRLIRADLDRDGVEDYLIQEPANYTGGSIYWIFSSEEGGCRPLGRVQGWFYLAEERDGYAQIVAEARAGGGEFVRTLFACEDGEYRARRAALYREEGSDGVYLREMTP